MNDPIVWIILIFVVVGIGAAVYFWLGKKTPREWGLLNQGWVKLARNTRLKYSPPERSIEDASLRGRWRNREAAAGIRAHSYYNQQTKQTIVFFTRLEVATSNPNKHFFRFAKRGGPRKTDAYFGVPAEPVDDKEVDLRFEVKSNPRPLARKILEIHTSVRDQLVRLKLVGPTELQLEGDAIVMEKEGIIYDEEGMRKLFDFLCDFAEAVESTT